MDLSWTRGFVLQLSSLSVGVDWLMTSINGLFSAADELRTSELLGM